MDEFESAKKLFYEKKYIEAQKIFLKFNSYYEAGLCAFLLKDFIGAKEIWQFEKNPDIDIKWGFCVLDLIKKQIGLRPTYFQLRAFFEVYLGLLIENEMFNDAENLINMYPYLSEINIETSKFIARTLFAYGYYESSLKFVKITEKQGFSDPEALFIGALIYFDTGYLNEAREELHKVLEVVPEYFPALELSKNLNT